MNLSELQVLESWSVFDCRSEPSRQYYVAVVRELSGAYACVRVEGDAIQDLYREPSGSLDRHRDAARHHLAHLEQNSCVVENKFMITS